MVGRTAGNRIFWHYHRKRQHSALPGCLLLEELLEQRCEHFQTSVPKGQAQYYSWALDKVQEISLCLFITPLGLHRELCCLTLLIALLISHTTGSLIREGLISATNKAKPRPGCCVSWLWLTAHTWSKALVQVQNQCHGKQCPQKLPAQPGTWACNNKPLVGVCRLNLAAVIALNSFILCRNHFSLIFMDWGGMRGERSLPSECWGP